MKNLVIIILSLFTTYPIFADGGMMALIQLKITYKTGVIDTVYKSSPDYLFPEDSIKNQDFLKRILLVEGTLNYYSEWIPFTCQFYDDTIEVIEIQHPDKIEFSLLTKIEVIKIHYQQGSIGIVHTLSESDSVWFNSKPIKTIKLIGDMCDFRIYIFANEDKVTVKFEEVKAFIENDDTEGNDLEWSQKLRKKLETIFKDERVVIVNICTC